MDKDNSIILALVTYKQNDKEINNNTIYLIPVFNFLLAFKDNLLFFESTGDEYRINMLDKRINRSNLLVSIIKHLKRKGMITEITKETIIHILLLLKWNPPTLDLKANKRVIVKRETTKLSFKLADISKLEKIKK